MKRIIGITLCGTALLSGCSPSQNDLTRVDPPKQENLSTPMIVSATPTPIGAPATPSTGGMDDVVARVSGIPITTRQLVDPLIEAHGLTMLLGLVELEIARQNAAKYHVVVTQQDFDDERDLTLEKYFKDSDDPKLVEAIDMAENRQMSRDKKIAAQATVDLASLRQELKSEREEFLAQYLEKKNSDPVEFGIMIKINTYLRKLIEHEWKDKITDAQLRIAFGQQFGEKVHVRYMLLNNMNEVTLAKGRMGNGESFESVAQHMSHDPATAFKEGDLPPFSREGEIPPKAFKDIAFDVLKDGQVSDAIAAGNSFYLIKRIRVLPPGKAVKCETVKPILYRNMQNALFEAGVKGLKQDLAASAQKEMKIINPVLAKQVQDKLDSRARAEKKAKEALDRQQKLRDLLKIPGTTRPADADPADDVPSIFKPAATQPTTQPRFELPKLSLPDTQPTTSPELNK